MAWKITTQPANEIFTLQEVKDYLKVDDSTEDALITTLLQSARQAAERYLNQALITQTITEKLDRLQLSTIYLSVSPVISASNYVVDTFEKPARLSLAYGKTWPTLYGNINDVTITYTAGYGSESSAVPGQIKQAILLMITDAYDNRQDYVKKLPTASEYLLDQYRVQLF